MYEVHFGLRQRPFRGIPDIECYYPATSHEQALACLLQAIDSDEGLALVTGDPGTGKTILGHILIDRLGENACCAFLTNTHFADRAALLQAINFDFGLPYQAIVEQHLRLDLTDFLLKNYAAGRRTVLIIDEAQHLTPDLLEELRLLGNLEGKRGKTIQTVLLALPALLQMLELTELKAFDQRLAVRVRLDPLGLHESADYLVHQLRAVGGATENIISDEALQILARGGQGIPRLLNRAAQQAFSLAASGGEEIVDAEAAMEALAQVGLEDGEETQTDTEQVLTTANEGEDCPETNRAEVRGPTLQSVTQDVEPVIPGNPEAPRDPGRSRRLFAAPKRPA